MVDSDKFLKQQAICVGETSVSIGSFQDFPMTPPGCYRYRYRVRLQAEIARLRLPSFAQKVMNISKVGSSRGESRFVKHIQKWNPNI